MNVIRLLWLAVALLPALLTACTSPPPTQAELDAADYGRPMSQAECEAVAWAWLNDSLLDPQSAQITYKPIYKGWNPGAFGKGPRFGYRLDATVNGKNAYGGYTGNKPYWFLMKNGELTGVAWPVAGGDGKSIWRSMN